MTDAERGRELNRLYKLQSKLIKTNANQMFIDSVTLQIDQILAKIASRFLDVFGPNHKLIKELTRR